jgi:hypothetical protein
VLSVSERTLVRLAWCAWAAAIALVAAEVGMLLAVNYGFSGARTYDYGVVTIFAPVYATLGLVVATRRPRHPIGWLLMGCGLTIAMQAVAGQYAALAGAAALPGRLHGCGPPPRSKVWGLACWCCCSCCSRPGGRCRRAGGRSLLDIRHPGA